MVADPEWQRRRKMHQDAIDAANAEAKAKGVTPAQLQEEKKMKNPCWKGYEMVGTKTKDGKEVPNCVPKNESIKESNDCGCNSLNEGRSVKSLAKELYAVIEHIQGYVEIYKRKSYYQIGFLFMNLVILTNLEKRSNNSMQVSCFSA